MQSMNTEQYCTVYTNVNEYKNLIFLFYYSRVQYCTVTFSVMINISDHLLLGEKNLKSNTKSNDRYHGWSHANVCRFASLLFRSLKYESHRFKITKNTST